MLRYRLLCSCGSFSPAMLPLSTPRRQLSTLPPQTFPAVLPLSMLLTQPFSCCAAAFHAAPAAPNTAAATFFLLRCRFPRRAGSSQHCCGSFSPAMLPLSMLLPQPFPAALLLSLPRLAVSLLPAAIMPPGSHGFSGSTRTESSHSETC